jgi:hypothetical protein
MGQESSYRPVQIKSSDSNSNKYLGSSNPPPILMDKYSRDFDMNSIIDNYAKQKNNGMGRNLDVSYAVPNTTNIPTNNYNQNNNNNNHNNHNKPNNMRPGQRNSDVSFV